MPTHLYCLLSTSDAAAVADGDVEGILGTPVRALHLDPDHPKTGMVAWVSTVDAERVPRDATAASWVRWHDAVTQVALVRAAGVVPALLSDPYPDDESCRGALYARTSELADLWGRANGMVEMTLILAIQSSPEDASLEGRDVDGRVQPRDSGAHEPAAGPGRRYLEARRSDDPVLAHADEIERVARQLAGVAGAVTRDASTRGSPHTGQLSLSHLISREATIAYQTAVARVAIPPALRLIVDGPRAPYSFAALSPPSRRHGTILAD